MWFSKKEKTEKSVPPAPKFKAGDLVTHRLNGRRMIVLGPYYQFWGTGWVVTDRFNCRFTASGGGLLMADFVPEELEIVATESEKHCTKCGDCPCRCREIAGITE